MARDVWLVGASWQRWDPHIHAPGTLKEDGFGDHTEDATWAAYFAQILSARPAVAALGITDYFVPRGYRLFRERAGGKLPADLFVFPNVELRLKTRTERGNALNVHLLVSPDDPDHLAVITSKLQGLVFSYGNGEKFRCTEEDLRRLGRAYKKTTLTDEAALRAGASVFLVEYEDFAGLKKDPWVSKNVLFGVAAGGDGLGGLSKDGSFSAHREELGAIADVVFSGQSADRKFWAGEHPDFEKRGYVTKPCLHGSDAHSLARVLNPEGERLCWIRARATFDGLRQTLAEPIRRVQIGPNPPLGPSAGNVIRCVRINGAAWLSPNELTLNDGLVTVVGARGSGKTALADLVAFGGDAQDANPGNASFFRKAAEHLGNLEVELEWGDGVRVTRRYGDAGGEPRVRYLSQQFVERLSQRNVQAASGAWGADDFEERAGEPADELLAEIERVVFDALPEEDRVQCSTFGDLRDLKLGQHLGDRTAQAATIQRRTEAIADEHEKRKLIPKLEAAVTEATRAREGAERELAAIPQSAPPAHVQAHAAAFQRLAALQTAIAQAEARAVALAEVSAQLVRNARHADELHVALSAQYGPILSQAEWEQLKPKVDDAATSRLAQTQQQAKDEVARLRQHGVVPTPAGGPSQGLAALVAAVDAAKKTLGEDDARTKRRGDLERKVQSLRVDEARSRATLDEARGASERIKAAQQDRNQAYGRIFETIVAEAEVLQSLYAPLRARLLAEPRLAKLSFFVTRQVDLHAWVRRGEQILDLRRLPFQGRGSLEAAANRLLLAAWRSGGPAEAWESIGKFLSEFGEPALQALRQGATPKDFGEWIYSTQHISVRYGIRYEDVELAKLSPGARGVLLLTLYLAIDESDERPLVIDQPEENLDPKSVYSSLVPFFRDAARRRQIIMVTHNANLVVNTDSDQVIVAEAMRTSGEGLPSISYSAGGLEDSQVRSVVCQYLEGGEEAFRRRAERYGARR
ncbi:MAG: AAA family ATPase [Myxococcaceae bacterium]|nr:AAA family ATPase [Myxococcaceae bacterium]